MKDLDTTRAELMDLSQRLLDAISEADWETYSRLCDPSITAIEPESHGNLVEGMDFHAYYFDLGPGSNPRNTTISSPHLRMLGDTAVVSYVRMSQQIDEGGKPATLCFSETRVWHRDAEGNWRNIHVHRSRCA